MWSREGSRGRVAMTLHRVAALVVVCAEAALGALIPVMDWSLNYGYCKASTKWLRREMLEPIRAEVGDVVEIKYATDGDMSGHDVLRYPDFESWAACDESKATYVAREASAGGGCEASYDFHCLRHGSGVKIDVDGAVGDSIYLACSGDHCGGGVKLRVDVVEERAVPVGGMGPKEIVVPEWTDDFGFCDAMGEDADDGVHRARRGRRDPRVGVSST